MPAPVHAKPKTVSGRTTVSTLYPEVLPSIALIEVEGRAIDPNAGSMTTAGGLGSGVLISDDGLVLTAAHVVQTADRVRVYFQDSIPVDAHVIRSDPQADVSLIKLERVPASAKPAKLGNSDEARVGDEVFVVGAPLGLSHTLTVGHLSARRRPDAMVSGLSNAELFQTDAAINQGNSGGPMFNMKGEVIGIVSHIISLSGGFEGLGFAVTSKATQELLLDETGFWTGMSGYRLTGRLAEVFNLPHDGVLVEVVAKDSPAQRLGLRGGDIPVQIGEDLLVVGGDIILEVQGIRIVPAEAARIRGSLASLTSGDTISVTIMRAGEVLELKTAVP